MKKEIITVGIIIVLIVVGFSGCLNESTVTDLAKRMEDTYNSILDYRANITYTTYNEYTSEEIKTIKKPDKLRCEYLMPDYKNGDIDIINGNTEWRYDKSKNIAYQNRFDINIGEESLETPDFLTMLLFLMHNFDVIQLDDELVGKFNTSVIEITPKIQTTFSKMKYWLDKITLFPIKWEVYDEDGEVKNSVLVTNFEINVGVPDSEFEMPEGIKILTPSDWVHPTTIEECEEAVGFSILFPTYLPEGYTLDEDYAIGSGGTSLTTNETIGIYEIDYFQNRIMRQVSDTIDTIIITYPCNDSYAEIRNSTTNEVLDTVYTRTGNFPKEWYGNIYIETITYDITLQEALENIFENQYGSPKLNPVKVNISGIQGEYYVIESTDYTGTILYRTSCLSWNLEEYWLFLSAGGEGFLDSTEMIKIAESIKP